MGHHAEINFEPSPSKVVQFHLRCAIYNKYITPVGHLKVSLDIWYIGYQFAYEINLLEVCICLREKSAISPTLTMIQGVC